MTYENTLFWRYDPAAPVPTDRDPAGSERVALAEILRCLPKEVSQLGSRFDGATDAGNALMNSALAITRHLNNLLNSWYLGATLPDSARGLAERKLVSFSLAPTLSYGKETEGLRTLLAVHAAVGESAWPELTEMASATLPPECALYKLAARAIGETLVDMPGLQEEYLQNMVEHHIRGNSLPSLGVLEFLGATVPLRNDTTGHNLGFTSAGAAVVARYLAPALRAFLTHAPVRTALTHVRIGTVVRLSSTTHVYVELDAEGSGWPSEVFELDTVGMIARVESRVVVRLAPEGERTANRATFAARYVEFPTPAGSPAEAQRKVRAEVLGYLLRDGLPPPTSDALKPLDGTGWTPTGQAEQEAYVAKASKEVMKMYTTWLVAVEKGVALSSEQLPNGDRDLLADADPDSATLSTEAVLKRIAAQVAAGREARRKHVIRLLAERAVSVAEIGRTIGDPTLTFLTLREMKNQNALGSDIPWTADPSPEDLASTRFSVWLVRTELPSFCQALGALRDSETVKPGMAVPWTSVRVLIESLRDLVDSTLTHKEFPPSRGDAPELGKDGVLAILDDWLTTPPTEPGRTAPPPDPPALAGSRSPTQPAIERTTLTERPVEAAPVPAQPPPAVHSSDASTTTEELHAPLPAPPDAPSTAPPDASSIAPPDAPSTTPPDASSTTPPDASSTAIPDLAAPAPGVQSESGLRLSVGGENFRARGITGIFRELTRAFADRPGLVSRFAGLAGPEALFGTNRSLFYTAEQLAAGVRIRQPVRLNIGGQAVYFEGSVPPDVGLLHLARLLHKSGLPSVAAWLDGTQVYPIPDGGADGGLSETRKPSGLTLRFEGPGGGAQVAAGRTVKEFFTDLMQKLLASPENLSALDGLLPVENTRGADSRRYLVARTALHKDRTPFRAPLELLHDKAGVLYLETHLSHDGALSGAKTLLERFGLRSREMPPDQDGDAPPSVGPGVQSGLGGLAERNIGDHQRR